MIDYIKFVLPSIKYKEQFLANTKYKFDDTKRRYESKDWIFSTGKYKSLKIKVDRKHVTVFGSIHKFYNEVTMKESQNYDDFSYEKLLEAIAIIEKEFNIDLKDSKVQNLEFGVNIRLDRCPTNFLKENLILMKYKEPKIEDFNSKGHYREFDFVQFYMKVYDKGRQYELGENVLRLEVKTRKSEIFKDYISTVTDLLDKSNLLKLKAILLERVSELLICDTIIPVEVINKDDLNLLNHYWNPKYWIKLKDTISTRKARDGIREFRKLMQKYNYESLHQNIIRAVSYKFDDLLGYVKLETSDVVFDTYV